MKISKSGNGTPLVLLHGWGFDQSIWNTLRSQLDPFFTVYTLDLPGFGNTELSDWFDFKARMLATLPSRFAIAGWSLGGLFATRLVSETPERISHLINIASSPCFLAHENWPGVEAYVLEMFTQRLLINPLQTRQDFISLQAGNVRLVMDYPYLDAKALLNGLEILENWDLRPLLASIKTPTRYLFGRLDAIVTRKTMTHMQTRYPQFQYQLFEKSAHMPFLSQEEQFISSLKAFIL